MKKIGFIAMVGVFCLLISGCLSFSINKEIPEVRRADTTEIQKLIVGTWERRVGRLQWVFDVNGKYIQLIGSMALESKYEITGNIITISDTNLDGNDYTESGIIQIDKTGKKLVTDLGSTMSFEFKKINDNHDSAVYAEQINKTWELAKAANEKAEAEARARKVAAGYTEAGIISTRVTTPPGFYLYASVSGKHRYYRSGRNMGDTMLIGFSIVKINDKDPVWQLGDYYWIPEGPCKITYSLTFQGGNDIDVEIRGKSGWIETTSPIERTVEGSVIDSKSYDLVFELDEQMVAQLFLVGGARELVYSVRIVPR